MILVIDCFKQVKGVGKSIGIYNLVFNLIRSLAEERARTKSNVINYSKIIVLGNEYNRSDFDIDGVDFVSVRHNPLNKLICIVWELFLVSKVCKKLKADRVLFPRGFCALTHPVKDSIIIHDLIPFYYDKHYHDFFNKLENAYIMSRMKSSIKFCNQVITISEASKKEILDIVKVNIGKIVMIHNGCNAILNIHKTYMDKPYIIAITSNLPHKNAESVIKSYIEYYETARKPIDLKIIGISDVEEYGIPKEIKAHITCFKFIEEDQEFYRIVGNGSIFLFLSLIEGFGFPPIEGMQLGVPVVCSNLSSLPEVVGDAAMLVNPFNHKEVGQTLDILLSDSEKQKLLIEKGYQNIARFSWESRAKLYWEALIK
ncbi:MAG TPA: glycosyltransferase family 1 protein [Firmicutes bacterium]|nr:glycosyltransferase family 1 protein [Bacillota bacterium]